MENRRKDMQNGLTFGSILLIIFTIFLLINPLSGSEKFSFKEQVTYTVLIIAVIISGWIFYLHQRKLDESKNLNKKDNRELPLHK